MSDSTLRPLSRVPRGRTIRIAALAGGEAFQSRLISMGLRVGNRATVVRSSNGSGGPTLVKIGETRLAIGHGMADRIMVEVAER